MNDQLISKEYYSRIKINDSTYLNISDCSG